MKITNAVIAVAGSGTRFFPVTKSLPKEMIPILDKPIIHYLVQELVDAGIEHIILVTRYDKSALEDYFDDHPQYERELEERKKYELLEAITWFKNKVDFTFIRQKGPYGNGTPVMNARRIIGNQPFIYAFGDDLVKSTVPFTKQIIETYQKTPGIILGAQEVPWEDVHRYGVIATDSGRSNRVTRIIEKPTREEAPSNWTVFGRFLLVPEIFEVMESIPTGKNNELWLTDGIERCIEKDIPVYYKTVDQGKWLTTGDPISFFRAYLEYIWDNPAHKKEMMEFIEKKQVQQ